MINCASEMNERGEIHSILVVKTVLNLTISLCVTKSSGLSKYGEIVKYVYFANQICTSCLVHIIELSGGKIVIFIFGDAIELK